MKYVVRNDRSKIAGIYFRQQNPEQEALPDDHPDLLAFRLARAKREKLTEIEARARAVAAARLPADLQTVLDAERAKIETCTDETALAALDEPVWPA